MKTHSGQRKGRIFLSLKIACLFSIINVSAENNPYVGQCIDTWGYDVAYMQSKEAQIGGRHIDCVEMWVEWSWPFSQISTEVNAVYDNGSWIELAWQSSTSIQGSIAAGSYDDLIRSFATDVAAWGKPMNIRMWHEMNLHNPDPNNFKNAWRRIVNIFREQGADNVRWVYSVNWSGSNYMGCYPGDDVVDFMSIDGYNWGNEAGWSHWQSFNDAFWNAYQAVKAPGKKIIISEWGCAEGGGNKADWIRDAFWQIRFSGNYDLIYATMWYDLATGDTDFRLATSQAALNGYAEATNFTQNQDAVVLKQEDFRLRANAGVSALSEMHLNNILTFDFLGRIQPAALLKNTSGCVIRLTNKPGEIKPRIILNW